MTRANSFSRVLGLIAIGASTVFAGTLAADPPARVGRLNYMNGAVSMRPAGSDDWVPAVPNRPLTTGDKIWTDNNSRAELHVGSTAIRIDAQTELDLTVVDDNILQLRLAQGSMNIIVRHLNDGEDYEIDTPNGAVGIGRAGEYRIDAGPDGTTSIVTVWNGSVQVTSAGSSFAVNPRQQAVINGTDSPTYNLVDAPAYDAWDQWCVSRDQREANSQSAQYVSTEMTGYEDLDAYGHWQQVPGYGAVWYPAGQVAGWAPYHTGRWVWVDPWGWTWVDSAPWGYAPYHYGRWVYAGGYWGWVPGQMAPRPVYAPALVAFVGAPAPRPGFSVGVAVGVGATVAWFALGPQEVYHPAYATSPTYVRQVNVTNVTNVTNITNVTNVNNTTNVTNVQYRNQAVPGAMAATTNTAFASARTVQSAPAPITPAMQSAPVTGMAPAVVPTRASLAAAPAAGGAPVTAPPASVQNRAVVAKMTPPPPPVPFAAKQQALASNGGRPLNPTQEATIRQSNPSLAAASSTMYKPATTAGAGGGLKAVSATAQDKAPAYHLASQPTNAAHPVSRGGTPASAEGGHATGARAVHTNSALAGGTNTPQATNGTNNGNKPAGGNNGNKPANTNKNGAHKAPKQVPAEKPAKAEKY